MKLNHLNLTVSDVPRTHGLLETYFGLTTLMSRGNEFAAMTDDNGSALTLMGGEQVSYPGTFHIGFMQESEERADEIGDYTVAEADLRQTTGERARTWR